MVVILHLVIVFFSDDSSYSSSRCSNSSPLVGQSSSPSNHFRADNIRDDTRSSSTVNLSPLVHNAVTSVSSARNEHK